MTRARLARRGALLAALAAAGAPTGRARAGGDGEVADPHRRVAVLEYRGGSTELRGIGQRVERLLRQQTSLRVIEADQARARYAELDSDVSRCAGQAACVARVGRRLGVADVVLVGVGEFGDVILTVQRVEVARGASVSRVAEAFAAGANPDDEALAGYLRRVLPAGDFRRFGILRIAADLAGADVAVGGRRRGTTPVAPLRVPAPAKYDIVVSKAGYVDFRASVAVPPEAEVVVRAELSRQGDRPWYARWWVISLAGVVAAGAVTTAFVVSRQDDDEVPVVIRPF